MKKQLKDECSKCGAPAPIITKDSFGRLGAIATSFTLTEYCCEECGKWNSLKLRKWFREQKAKERKEKD